jgi:hypothetical protein
MVPKSVMENRNQVNGLYPIIRRVRRPLLPVDAPADAKPAAVPAATTTQPEPPKKDERRSDKRSD